MENGKEIILFETKDKSIALPVMVENESVWLNRNQIAMLFERDIKTIGKHINNALKEELAEQNSVVAKFATTASDNKKYMVEHYNLDVIISVGYRVKSKRGVEFRRWANSVLKDYIIKGYAVNHNRILYNAKRYVHIMTPYLILDNEMITALTYAARRGVDVKILMPGIPDKPYAFAVAKTFYPELLKAGVKIYQFQPGFLHAKSFVADDEKAVVGTINLDYRSLYLHFECAAFFCHMEAVNSVEEDFQQTLRRSRRITLKTCKNEKTGTKIYGRLLRLIAPLM